MTEIMEEPLISAVDFGRMPDEDCITELVRGKIERYPLLFPFIGFVCGRAAMEIDACIRGRSLGIVILKSGVITERNPDTVRGADVSYYSLSRLPEGGLPHDQYLDTGRVHPGYKL